MDYTLSPEALDAADTWLHHKKSCKYTRRQCSFPTKEKVCDMYDVLMDELELAIKVLQVMRVLAEK